MMESLLKDFELQHKNPSEEALLRWRKAVSIVKNPRRRFRMVADLVQRSEAEKKKRSIQETIRVALYVKKAALHFIDAAVAADAAAGFPAERKLSDEVRKAGFGIEPDELASVARDHDIKALRANGGVEGIARQVSVSLKNGINESSIPTRQKIFGCNRYTEKPSRSFWMFVWEALQDLTLIILMVCAVVSVGVGIATEGWPKGMYDGLGIILSIFLVVIVTAISDYKQSLQFRDLDREKKKISIQVIRDGRTKEVSIYDLVIGDVVQLSTGDIVPSDGIYISGYSLVIDESSLSGESEPVNIDEKKPFLLSGTKVQDGSGKMLVTAVGMKTEWGKLMETLNVGGEDETPLQVKLNGVATIIGKVGLAFAVLTFLVLTVRFLVEKALHHKFTHWSSNDASALLNYFAIAVTIIVVAVPEGLPLAVTLSLAFAMKKLMYDRALVRHLSACETMGSASCICTDKTGTLTTNHMVVDKIWICGKAKAINNNNSEGVLGLEISESALSLLLQVIFQNTGCEISKDEDGKTKILGMPTEKALLEFGLLLGGDFDSQRKESQILKVEPFSSDRKKMSVLVSLPEGGLRASCKGASEIVLKMCDKVVDDSGKPVHLSEEQRRVASDVIDGFSSEALRTLCLAFKDLDDASEKSRIPDFGYTLVAIVGIKDPVRPGVKDAVKTCLEAGITVRMVTGDNINTAKAIAKECGILTENGLAIEAPDFRNKTFEEMRDIIPKIQVMARSLPLDKHTLVTNLRNMFEEVVAVTGDGTNDAPALHEADIGLAMGKSGTEARIPFLMAIGRSESWKEIIGSEEKLGSGELEEEYGDRTYLLEIPGLGLKSVECIRLLSLEHKAFPVDVNVARILVRLGWIPLEPLPGDLQFHLLEEYPIMDSIQKYLWPRLAELDQRTLYELHYHMITVGKVVCTKKNPNCGACPMKAECRHFASAVASANISLPAPSKKGEERSIISATPVGNIVSVGNNDVIVNPTSTSISEYRKTLEFVIRTQNCEPIIEEPASPQLELDIDYSVTGEDIIEDDEEEEEEIPTIKLNNEAFKENVHYFMDKYGPNLQTGNLSRDVVPVSVNVDSVPVRKLKHTNRLRTEHQVYEIPDGHELLRGFEKRDCDDPLPYLLAIWTAGETPDSCEPPKKRCNSEGQELCNDQTCFSCQTIIEERADIVRGTIMVPCRTAMRGRFPLNGTYFQVNEVFAEHQSSYNPIVVSRSSIWHLKMRTVYIGTSPSAIFKGTNSIRDIQENFWKGFICVRGWDSKTGEPKPLCKRFHCPPGKMEKVGKRRNQHAANDTN